MPTGIVEAVTILDVGTNEGFPLPGRRKNRRRLALARFEFAGCQNCCDSFGSSSLPLPLDFQRIKCRLRTLRHPDGDYKNRSPKERLTGVFRKVERRTDEFGVRSSEWGRRCARKWRVERCEETTTPHPRPLSRRGRGEKAPSPGAAARKS